MIITGKPGKLRRNYQYDLLHVQLGTTPLNVCKSTWLAVFGFGLAKLDYVIERLGKGETSTAKVLASTASTQQSITTKQAFDFFHLDYDQHQRSIEQIVALDFVGDTCRSLMCAAWLCSELELIGSQEPNEDSITIDKTDLTEIHKDYREDPIIKDMGKDNILSYQEFTVMFDKAFPTVHMREFKNVTGKCEVCERLKALMKTCRNNSDR